MSVLWRPRSTLLYTCMKYMMSGLHIYALPKTYGIPYNLHLHLH